MKKILFTLLVSFYLLPNIKIFAQITKMKEGAEYFIGTEEHVYPYLNNNYSYLDPIEGVWLFTRIEYNNWGMEISRTPNEFKTAIICDKGNVKRAFVEVNFNRALCKPYRITYNIQKGSSGIYPCEPIGCTSLGGQYMLNPYDNTISREAIPWTGAKAVLIGVKIFPMEQPTQQMKMPSLPAEPIAPRKIENKNGWEAYIDWGQNIFPSYILSMGTLVRQFTVSPDYKGDPLSNLGILIDNPRANADIRVEIEETKYTKAVADNFTLEKRGERYAIFPKVLWKDYCDLIKHDQPFNLDFTFRVSMNGKPLGNPQTLTARVRTIDDCPRIVKNYKGERENLFGLYTAYVNEGHPKIREFRKEILAKKWVHSFSGAQRGETTTLPQVFAFWKLLRDRGVVYQSIADNGEGDNNEVYSQRVRLFEDVVEENQANCIDGTAILASCLKESGINPLLILVPGHAFLAYYPYDKDKTEQSMLFLETTLIGEKASEIPELYAKTPVFKAYKKTLLDHFSKQGIAMPSSEIELFVYATLYGAVEFNKSITENPDQVFKIDVDKARQTVKPISRLAYCNDIGTTPRFKPQYSETSSKNPPTPKSATSRIPTSATYSYQGVGTAYPDMDKFNSNAELKNGTYYKVQIEFTPTYDPNKRTIVEMQKLGRIDLEYLTAPDKQFYRVLVGDFSSEKDALPTAKKAKELGCKAACIVRYQDGNRMESIYHF